jgi:MFS family permease
MTAQPAESRANALAAADFWKLWFVGLVLFTVRWSEMLAMAVFVYRTTHSALLVAVLTMLRMVPMALFGAFVGAVADRWERHGVLFAVVLLLFGVSSCLAWLAWTGSLQVWHLAVATFVNGFTWATDNPVRRLLIGEVVGAEQVGRAMSIDIGTNNASRMVGPLVGGLILANVGIEGIFALSMVCYAAAAMAALAIRHRSGGGDARHVPFIATLKEGLALVRADRRIVAALVITVIFNVFGWPFTSMVPVIGQDHLKLGAQGIGLLASMDGLGAFAGAALIALWARPRHYPALYITGTFLYLALLPVFAFLPDAFSSGTALWLTGVTGSAFMTMQSTLIFRMAPGAARSRILGVLTVCIGIGPIGFLYLGWMAQVWGAQWAVAAIGAEGLVAMMLTAPLWRPLFRA